jgi:O26-antigen biosynthesis N-acetyl-L-fucosamine transferase
VQISILIDCYLPSLKSGARLVHDLALEMKRQGHGVTILTPSDCIHQNLEVSTEHGLRIARIRSAPIKGTPRALRAAREMRLSTNMWRRARGFLQSNPSDLIVFYSPTIFLGALVRRLKGLWGCPAYLILRDIFPQWAVDTGILRKGIIWKYFRMKEIQQYEAANLIAVESPANLEYFDRHFARRRYRVEVLYNWTSMDSRDLPKTGYRHSLNLQDKVIFLYGGNIGVVQDLDNFIRLAERLSMHPQAHFLLVGEGSEIMRLNNVIASRNLSNIQILPAMPEQEYMGLLTEADVGLISLDRKLKTHNTTGKMLGYMFCNKPILASVNQGNDLFKILGENRAGFCLRNGDDDGLTDAALRLANDAELRRALGANARNLLGRLFSSRAAVQQILSHFETSIAGAKSHAGGRLVSIAQHDGLRADS